MKHIEFELENQCRLYARARGWLAWKNENNGNKGIPDDSFLHPERGVFLFVEFKKNATAKLRSEQKTWRDRCGAYFVRVDNFETFKKMIDDATTNTTNTTGAAETL